MRDVVSWDDLYKTFKTKFPNISKGAIYFRPFDFMTIEIWFNDGGLATYNGCTNSLKRLEKTWK